MVAQETIAAAAGLPASHRCRVVAAWHSARDYGCCSLLGPFWT